MNKYKTFLRNKNFSAQWSFVVSIDFLYVFENFYALILFCFAHTFSYFSLALLPLKQKRFGINWFPYKNSKIVQLLVILTRLRSFFWEMTLDFCLFLLFIVQFCQRKFLGSINYKHFLKKHRINFKKNILQSTALRWF